MSQFDATLSVASSNDLEYGVLTSDCNTTAFFLSARCSIFFYISEDARFCLLAIPCKSVSPDKSFPTRGLQILSDSFNFWAAFVSGLMNHPVLLEALAQMSRCLSMSLGDTLPVSFGKSFVRILLSSLMRLPLISFWLQSIILIIYFPFAMKLCGKAAKAQCGCVSPMSDELSSSLIHLSGFSTNSCLTITKVHEFTFNNKLSLGSIRKYP